VLVAGGLLLAFWRSGVFFFSLNIFFSLFQQRENIMRITSAVVFSSGTIFKFFVTCYKASFITIYGW